MLFGRRIMAVCSGLFLVSSAQAAKVISIYNPWQSSPVYKNVTPQIWGGVVDWVKDAGPTNQFKPAGGPWWNFTFPSAKPGDFAILNRSFRVVSDVTYEDWFLYKSEGYDSAMAGVGLDLNIDAMFASHDTVWMVPDPLQGGPAQFYTSRPREITVHFWNPWENDDPGQAPSVKVGSKAWAPLTPSGLGDGWYQIGVVGFFNLDLQFRSPKGSSYLGAAGRTTTPSTAVRFDSLASAAAIWVYQNQLPLGRPVASTSPPTGRVTEAFNPWDGQFPFQLPRFQFADGHQALGKPLYDRCGWYRVVRYDLAPSAVYFTNTSSAVFGLGGLPAKVGFPLSDIWAAGRDTARIYPDSSGKWNARADVSAKVGQCFLTKLGAIIRDFDTTHPAFERENCGLVRGMVQDTIGADRKPLAAPGPEKCRNGTLKEWFTDIPSKNYSVCRDIPLELNPDNGLYGYDNPNYFPIDDIDSTLDKFNRKAIAEDGKPHNFHFCLESHAVFDYHKGQKFQFIGDDDVWLYIDGKLAVDLGGIHVAETASVDLDTLGLVEGKTYPFDFFFCERRRIASHMLITTSMNLRNPPEFELRESRLGPGKRQYDLFYHQKLGQGCDAIKVDKPTPGLYYLSGPQFSGEIKLATGIQHGGLAIRADSAQLVYDSLAMDKLVPGTYRVRVKMQLDTLQYRDIFFVVPPRPMPKFVLHDPWSGRLATSMPLDVYATLGSDTAKFAVFYKLDPVPGLRFCRDSACTSEIGPSELPSTGLGGEISRIWVRGDVEGIYSLKIRNAYGDSSDFRTRIVFQDRGIRWVDSLGLAVDPYSIAVEAGQAVRFWIESTLGDRRCDTCSELVLLSVSSPRVRIQNPLGAAIGSVKLNKGLGSLVLVSDVPTSSISLTATVSDSASWIKWSPIRWQLPPPSDAVMLDSDGDGRADRVVVRLTKPMDSASSWAFRWPDTSGGLDLRVASGAAALVDSNGLRLVFDLPPYAFGATSCPPAGCADLGAIVSSIEGDTVATAFAIRDGVPPVAMSGDLTFSGSDEIPDTLVVRFSEPVVVRTDLSTWVGIGDPVPGAQGKPVSPWNSSILPWTYRFDSTGSIVTILVDTNVAPGRNHKIRMNTETAGGLSDRQGNFATDTAAWGVVTVGPIRPRLAATPYPAVGRWDGTQPDLSLPQLSMQIRRGFDPRGEWKTLDGQPARGVDSASGLIWPGVKVSLNGLTDGGAYLYDNMGVFVANISLKPIVEAYDKGLIDVDPRGRYEIWISWNGVANNRVAPSGIYLMRIVGYRMVDNRPLIQQKVVRLGWVVRQEIVR